MELDYAESREICNRRGSPSESRCVFEFRDGRVLERCSQRRSQDRNLSLISFFMSESFRLGTQNCLEQSLMF